MFRRLLFLLVALVASQASAQFPLYVIGNGNNGPYYGGYCGAGYYLPYRYAPPPYYSSPYYPSFGYYDSMRDSNDFWRTQQQLRELRKIRWAIERAEQAGR